MEILTQGAKQLLGHPPVPTLPKKTNARKTNEKYFGKPLLTILGVQTEGRGVETPCQMVFGSSLVNTNQYCGT